MNNAIEISGLRKQYKNFLLDDISFSIPAGFVCGFIGENGAGNGTLLFDGLEYARQHMLLVNGGMTLVATLILLGSFLLSKRLYAKREF